MLLSTGAFFNGGGDGGAGASLDFSFASAATLNSTTVPLTSFGTADAGRYLLATVTATHSVGSSHTVTAVTLGGVGATNITNIASGTRHASIWIAAVPTGTSGDAVMTSTFNRFGVAVYRLVGLNSTTAHDSGGGVSSSIGAIAIDIPAGGCAVGVGCIFNSSPITMSGLANTDATLVGGSMDSVHASQASVAGETVNVDISVNSASACLFAASFR